MPSRLQLTLASRERNNAGIAVQLLMSGQWRWTTTAKSFAYSSLPSLSCSFVSFPVSCFASLYCLCFPVLFCNPPPATNNTKTLKLTNIFGRGPGACPDSRSAGLVEITFETLASLLKPRHEASQNFVATHKTLFVFQVLIQAR